MVTEKHDFASFYQWFKKIKQKNVENNDFVFNRQVSYCLILWH